MTTTKTKTVAARLVKLGINGSLQGNKPPSAVKLQKYIFSQIRNLQTNLNNFNAQTERLYKPETYEPDPATMWKKIFAAKRFKGKQLEIVKQLAAWREITARERNRPRKWILANHVIVENTNNIPTFFLLIYI